MTDIATLIERLRALPSQATPNATAREAADVLEAQAVEIVELRGALAAAHKVADMRVMGMISAKAISELRDRLAKLEREA